MSLGLSGWALAQQAPDEFMQKLTNELLDMVRKDPALKSGDLQKIGAVLDTKLKPYINFQRMTAGAVGPAWRQATPEQQKRLQEEFKILLVRTYAGALGQVSDQTISVKPLRAAADDKEVLVRTEVRGKGDPIQLDYRVEKAVDGSWKVYNMNVMGIWLVENYKTQFAQEISTKGVDGLIASLAERNKTNAKASK
jgi:phospholipid transport system substrate-binding protein